MSKNKENRKAEGETEEVEQTGAEAIEGEDDGTQEGADGGDQAGAGDGEGEGDGAGEGADADKDIDKGKDNIDYDKELEDEKKRGKPDPEAAHARIKGKRAGAEGEGEGEAEGDDDKPLTRKDIAAIEARVERKALTGQALSIAKALAGRHANSDKEAQLIVARWGNRTFPAGTPLMDQLEEVYAGMHRRKIIGERDEALRALAGRSTAGKNAAGAHRQPSSTAEPKIAPQNAAAIKAAGFAWNGVTRRYEKKLSNGGIVVRDSKTGATQLIPKK